jgi:hypothetical protein
MFVYKKEIFDEKDDIPETFVCSGCQHVTFRFLADQFGHSIGRLCCVEGVSKDGLCLVDGKNLKGEYSKKDFEVTEGLKLKQVKCIFGPKCQWKGQFADLDVHLEQNCKEGPPSSALSCSFFNVSEVELFVHAQFDNNESFECIRETKELIADIKEEQTVSTNDEDKYSNLNVQKDDDPYREEIVIRKPHKRYFKDFGFYILVLLFACLVCWRELIERFSSELSNQDPFYQENKQRYEIGKEAIKELKFDSSLKGAMIEVTGNRAKFMADGKLVLLNVPVTSGTLFRFQVINKNSSEFAIGCCSKTVAEQTRFNFEKNSDVKMNYFLFRTYTSNPHADAKGKLEQNPRGHLEIRNNDFIEIKLNEYNRSITVTNENTGLANEIPLGNFTNLGDLYPCINFETIGESVKLVHPLKNFRSLVGFTLGTFQKSQFNLNNNVISLTHPVQAQFVLANESFQPDQFYKFFINGPLELIAGVGVCSRKITSANDFRYTSKDYYNGAFVFHAGAKWSYHGKYSFHTYFVRPTQVKFFDKNELTLKFNRHLKIIELRNESWMLSDSFPFEIDNQEKDELRICVLLNGDGQEIYAYTA